MIDSQLTEMAHTQMPLTSMLGLRIESAAPEQVVATGEWKREHCTAGGMVHGGYLMALADSAGAMCAYFNLPEGATTSTVESNTNFFRPVTSGTIRFTATPVHVGRSVIVIQTDVTNEDDKIVARTTQTQMVVNRS